MKMHLESVDDYFTMKNPNGTAAVLKTDKNL